MKRNLAQLGATAYDLAIIGGGIHGAYAAWDAALRGLTVALVEQADFGHATSANSQRIVHGGLRYLQRLDFARMRQSIRERRTLLRSAPHLVRPLPCLMPTYARRFPGRQAMGAALAVDRLLSCDRNRGLGATSRLPHGRLVSAAECLERAPGLPTAGLDGGALWYDAQILDSERLTLAVVQSAADAGADVANHVRVTGPAMAGSRGVAAADELTGEPFAIEARMVLNAAGPWASAVLASFRQENPRRTASSSLPAHRVQGICLVTRRLPNAAALAVASPDPDPRLDGLLFLVPWRDDLSLVGCAYPEHDGDPRAAFAPDAEIERLLAHVNRAYPPAALTRNDVKWACAGLLPTTPAPPGTRPALEQHPRLVDHEAEDGIPGLVSMVGVKYTTARLVASAAIDQVMERLGRPRTPSRTAREPLHGGAIADLASFTADLVRERPHDLPATALHRLAGTHGTGCRAVLDTIAAEPEAGEALPGAPAVLRAEVIHAARHEMAMTLDDVVFRRTSLAIAGDPAAEAVIAATSILAREHGWSRERVASEQSRTAARLMARRGAPPPVTTPATAGASR
jgi:glycerol-3-phosphate dehydrogenase